MAKVAFWAAHSPKLTFGVAQRFESDCQRLGLCSGPLKPLLKGRHLQELGMSPSPQMGRLLKAAFEAQCQGLFSDLEGAKKWVMENGAKE